MMRITEFTLGVDPWWVWDRLAEKGLLDRIYPDDERRQGLEVLRIAQAIGIAERLGNHDEIPKFLRR